MRIGHGGHDDLRQSMQVTEVFESHHADSDNPVAQRHRELGGHGYERTGRDITYGPLPPTDESHERQC